MSDNKEINETSHNIQVIMFTLLCSGYTLNT